MYHFSATLYFLHIHDTLVSILTDMTRLYNVVVTYYHTIVYVTSKHCIVAINKDKGEFHLIIYFKSAILFIMSSTAFSSCCSLFYIYHIFFSTTRSYTLSLFTHIEFSQLTNTKVSG